MSLGKTQTTGLFLAGRLDEVAVHTTVLPAETDHWPRLGAAAELCGFAAAQALPMWLRRDVIGHSSSLTT
jgi:hypothetical protein